MYLHNITQRKYILGNTVDIEQIMCIVLPTNVIQNFFQWHLLTMISYFGWQVNLYHSFSHILKALVINYCLF